MFTPGGDDIELGMIKNDHLSQATMLNNRKLREVERIGLASEDIAHDTKFNLHKQSD